MTPRLTIAMPIYNAEHLVAKAVSAILRQTFDDFELILVDDASTDATLSVLTAFADPRIRIFHNPVNSGAYYSRNVGLYYARGELIAFVDSDDIVSPFRFEKLVRCFDESPDCLYIETRYLRFHLDTGRIWFRDWTRGIGYPTFRRAVKEALGFFLPLRANGDREYADRVLAHFGPQALRLASQFTYWGSQHPDNLTSKIPGETEPRLEVQRYASDVFHKRPALRVDFPFKPALLDEFRGFQLFLKDFQPDFEAVRAVPARVGEDAILPQRLVLLEIIDLAEQTLTAYFERNLALEADARTRGAATQALSAAQDRCRQLETSLATLREQRDAELRHYRSVYDAMPRWWRRLGRLVARIARLGRADTLVR